MALLDRKAKQDEPPQETTALILTHFSVGDNNALQTLQVHFKLIKILYNSSFFFPENLNSSNFFLNVKIEFCKLFQVNADFF